MAGMINGMFRLKEHGSSIKVETMAGATTFVTMAYIIFVNPAMLADAGMPREAAFAATVWGAALTTLFMGMWANLPIALAPGMGINAFFAYTVVLGMGLPWQTALGAVFISGVVFFLLSVTKLREQIIRAVPLNLKLSITVGIGMFIAFIGLKSAGIVVDDPVTFVALGNMKDPATLLSLFGVLFIAVLESKNVRGSILLGMAVTTAAGMIVGAGPVPHGMRDILSFSIPSFMPTFLQLDIFAALEYGLFTVLFTMTMVDLFDSMGTIIGLSRKAGLMKEDGSIEGLDKALVADSCGTMLSGLLGTPAVTSYLESSTGIAEGGRTGLTSVTVGVLFLVSLVFAPLVGFVQGYATAPALIIVGSMMMQETRNIDFSSMADALPAFLTIITMPLTGSIATGFGMGFISYVLIRLCTGRAKEVSLVMWVVSACFIVNFSLR
ncbi:NCS2 family permease [Mailhella massiliensis]|uniref:NCS2 family permease n=1 Tax=Mailhella massiliensis TaxID=1903261 RepID=A0A921AWC3_9BACT|nr:NCS2 family permease [Mailhella massiliensis]HJD97328.1 NCS2 family permease [Mailhella massiliensis]